MSTSQVGIRESLVRLSVRTAGSRLTLASEVRPSPLLRGGRLGPWAVVVAGDVDGDLTLQQTARIGQNRTEDGFDALEPVL